MTQNAAPKSRLLTFEEYLKYDDGSDTRYELVDGELVEMPPESPENSALGRFLLFELAKHVPFTLLGYKDTEIEVTGRRARCRLPDLIVHSEESFVALAGATRGTITRDMPPPALVVEIVSPGSTNRARDYRHKHTEYAARGIAEYWIVDPETRKITVCKWIDGLYEDMVITGADRIESDLVLTLEMTATRLFALEQN